MRINEIVDDDESDHRPSLFDIYNIESNLDVIIELVNSIKEVIKNETANSTIPIKQAIPADTRLEFIEMLSQQATRFPLEIHHHPVYKQLIRIINSLK